MFHMLEEEYHLHQIHWLKLIDYYAIHLLRMGEKWKLHRTFVPSLCFLQKIYLSKMVVSSLYNLFS